MGRHRPALPLRELHEDPHQPREGGSAPRRPDGIVNNSKDPRDSHLHHAEGLTRSRRPRSWSLLRERRSNKRPVDVTLSEVGRRRRWLPREVRAATVRRSEGGHQADGVGQLSGAPPGGRSQRCSSCVSPPEGELRHQWCRRRFGGVAIAYFDLVSDGAHGPSLCHAQALIPLDSRDIDDCITTGRSIAAA